MRYFDNKRYSLSRVVDSTCLVNGLVRCIQFSSVQSLSCVQLFATPWTAARQASLELAQTHVHQVSDAIQPSHPLLSPFPPTFNLS